MPLTKLGRPKLGVRKPQSSRNKAHKHLITAHSLPDWERGHQSCVAVTRTGVATLGRVKNFKGSRKRSNSSTGHFDRG